MVAPGGLYYDKTTDLLYVASADDNAVFSISNASARTSDGGTGTTVYSDAAHLHGALMMSKAPNGDLLVSNADVINSDSTQPSEIVEFTTAGQFVKELSVDPNQGGSFGLVASPGQLAAVDDNTSGLFIWTIPQSVSYTHLCPRNELCAPGQGCMPRIRLWMDRAGCVQSMRPSCFFRIGA